MRTPKIILKGLVSGRVKLTPELLDTLKRHRQSKSATHGKDPSPACKQDQRLIFATPLAGRWIRCSGMFMVCASLMLPLVSRAAGTDTVFEQANRAFAEGNMSAAARGYQSVISDKGYSAPVLFNLANAEFRDGKIGQAILDYERAKSLAPNDPDIAANLEFARRKAGLPAEAHSRMDAVSGMLSTNAWSAIAVTAILMIASIPLLKRLLPARRLALNTGAAAGGLAFLVAITAIISNWSQLNRAIIIAPETAARVSPVTVIQPLFTLHAGETVTLKRFHGAFALVTDSQGHEGWVSREALSPIIPRESSGRNLSAS